jgi:Acetyl-coenzyme A synthetase N-terminus
MSDQNQHLSLEALFEADLLRGTFDLPSPGLTFEAYRALYNVSLRHNDAFWAAAARQLLQWDSPFTKIRQG